MGFKMHVQDLPLFPLGERLRTYKYIIRFIYVYRRFSTRDTGMEYYTVRSAEIEPRLPLKGFTGRSRSAYVDCPRLGTTGQK